MHLIKSFSSTGLLSSGKLSFIYFSNKLVIKGFNNLILCERIKGISGNDDIFP